MVLLWVALRNLLRHQWLGAVLALSISIPLMAFLVLNAMQADLNRRFDHLSQTFLVVQQGGATGEFHGSRLPLELSQVLRALGASQVVPEIRTVTGTRVEDMVLLRGITLENYQQIDRFQLLAGRPLQPGDPPRRVMLGTNLAQKRQVATGETILLRGREFEVQAVFSTGTFSDYQAWISLSDAQQLLGWEDVSIYIIPAGESLRPGDTLPDGVVVTQMGESGVNLVSEFRQFFEIFGLLSVVLGISAAVNLGVALWRMAWQARREFAILQAVGFTRRALALYLGVQGAAITLLGFGFGVLEAWLVMRYAHLNNAWITIQPELDIGIIILALLYALGVLVTSTILPVGWLARLNLVTLMRAE